MATPMPLSETDRLPRWRRPEGLLYLMAAAMPLSFATWSALLNNFVIEVASFTGKEIGWLHTVREIPGLLAVVVIAILLGGAGAGAGAVDAGSLGGGDGGDGVVHQFHWPSGDDVAVVHRVSLLSRP
jgi:hypothetical protein